MEYKEFDEQFPDNILSGEKTELSDDPDRADPEERVRNMRLNISSLSYRIAQVEKKIDSIKISSADARAAKAFAKEIFKNVVQQGLDDISVRLRSVEDAITQSDGCNSVEVSSLERKVCENKRKIDGLTGITYTLVVMNFIHLLIVGMITAGRALAKAVRVISRHGRG